MFGLSLLNNHLTGFPAVSAIPAQPERNTIKAFLHSNTGIYVEMNGVKSFTVVSSGLFY